MILRISESSSSLKLPRGLDQLVKEKRAAPNPFVF
jgi:hypothetical protein